MNNLTTGLLMTLGGLMMTPVGAQPPPPPASTPIADCPVEKTGSIPAGGGTTICVFRTEACGATPPVQSSFFDECSLMLCACNGSTCEGLPTSPSGPSGPGGVQPIALAFRANTRDIPWVVPVASKLVQDTAGQITTFGVGDYKVKYLKVLRLQSPAGQQYFALFKVFKSDDASDVGDDFEDTDSYIGVRVGQPAAAPAGGYVDLNSSSTTDFQKLQPFVPGTPGGSGYVREAGAKLPIPSGPMTNSTWFHLFGTVL